MTAISAICLGESPRHEALAAALRDRGYQLELTRVASFQELQRALSPGPFDLVLIDQVLDEAQRGALQPPSAPLISEAAEDPEALSRRLIAAKEAPSSAAAPIDVKRIRKVTHDLSNALALISGFADLLAESELGSATGPAERYLSIIQRRSGEAVAFLEEIRSLLQGKAGPKALNHSSSAPAAAAPDAPAPRAAGAPLSLLLIDDEPRLLEVLSAHLRRAGHAVATAGDPREGLERFSAGGFDLVLTDQEMPGLTGEEVTRAIKERAPRTPVILLTGHGEREGSLADRTLGKPVRPTDLLNAIRDLRPEDLP